MRLRRALSGIVLLLILLLAGSACAAELAGTVTWVHDGDTLKVRGIGTVRLIGIDVPEKADSKRDRYLREQGVASADQRRIAQEALRFVIATAKGKTVRLHLDGDQLDRHGRTLAYVLLPDGRNLNRLLIEQGLAVVYRRFDFRLKEDFLQAEAEARKQRRGLWAQKP